MGLAKAIDPGEPGDGLRSGRSPPSGTVLPSHGGHRQRPRRAVSRPPSSGSRAKGRVIVTGMGKSGHVARKIAATFASTGTPAHYVHPAEASHGDLGMVQPDDVIVALSWSGETAELADLIGYAKRFRVPLIAITVECAIDARDAGRDLPRPAEGQGGLPERARSHHLDHHAARARGRARGGAPRAARLHGRAFPGLPSRAASSVRSSSSCATSCIPASACRSCRRDPHGRAIARDQSAKGFGCVIVVDDGRHARRHRHGRRPAPAHERPTLLTLPVEAIMTTTPRTIAPDDAGGRERSSIIETRKKGAPDRRRGPPRPSASSTSSICCASAPPASGSRRRAPVAADNAAADQSGKWVSVGRSLGRLHHQRRALDAHHAHARRPPAVGAGHPPRAVVDPDAALAAGDRRLEHEDAGRRGPRRAG